MPHIPSAPTAELSILPFADAMAHPVFDDYDMV